jgi:hypothetical protein
MTESQLRTVIGLILVLGHILVIAAFALLALATNTPFAPGEGTTAIALVIPMFAANTMAVITHVRTEQENVGISTASPAKRARGDFAIYSILFSSLLVLALLGLVIAKALTPISFEQFKWTLSLIEALFGVYLSVFVKFLFKEV